MFIANNHIALSVKMKKTVSIFLCVILLFGLVSCGKAEDETTDVSTQSSAPVSSDYSEVEETKSQTSSTETSTTQKPVQMVRVTIPEGYTLLRISWLLEEKGLCKSDDFVNAAQTANKWLDISEFPFLKDTFNAKNVCFYLEGYIFPLTYDIPQGTDVKAIIKMFLNGAKQRFNEDFMARVKNSGYSIHEILTIASIIEKEVRTDEQRPMVSSVLHNRLKSKMPLQCDVAINYCEGVIKIAYPDKFPTIKEYYNAKNVGLLAGPICNPAKTEYLYFLIGRVPPYEAHYFKTYEEHNAYWKANKDRLTGE